MKFDLVIIGSGPSGQKGAFAAAKLGKKVAIVEHRNKCIGGVCLHSGTIPSKTLREAILHLTGFRQRDVYSEQFRSKRNITMESLRKKLESVTRTELDVIQEQFDRNGIEVFSGRASFVDAHHIQVDHPNGAIVLETDKVLVACGTRPSRPSHIPFDGKTVFDSDEILKIQSIPRSMVVIGAGVIGIEYAIMFATLGVEVTVVDGRTNLLEFCDTEIVDYLLFSARTLNMRFQLGENVETVVRRRDGQVAVKLESQKHLVAATALFSVGREGESDTLNLDAIGMETNSRGRIDINESFQTEVENVHAVGDIVGFPSLASSAMEQGRRAVLHAFGQEVNPIGVLPYGLYTIPEISMIGKNEKELTADKVPYEVGIARYHEIARGQIIGDDTGMLKILFHRETRKILGVHCIGDLATEIVHIGQAVMALGGKIDYFCETVFNYPTMAECYRVAAFNGLNRLCLEHEISVEEMTRSADPTTNIEKISAAIDVCETPVVSFPEMPVMPSGAAT
jgi:NAD(P) transhydrogenase